MSSPVRNQPRTDRSCAEDCSAIGDMPRLLTYKQVAEALQVSDRTVFALAKTGALKAVRFGHSVRFDRRDLEAFIDNAKGSGGAADVD